MRHRVSGRARGAANGVFDTIPLPSSTTSERSASTPGSVSARPSGHFTSIFADRCRAAEAERQRQLALREIAGAGLDHLPRRGARGAGHARERADGVAVRLRADEFHAQPVVALAAVVAQQPRRAVVGGDEQIRIAVAVVVAIGRAARDHRLLQRGAGTRRHRLEAAVAGVVEQVRRLRVRRRAAGRRLMSSATWPLAAKMSGLPSRS